MSHSSYKSYHCERRFYKHFAVLQLTSVCAYKPRIRLDVIKHIFSGSSAHVEFCLSARSWFKPVGETRQVDPALTRVVFA